MLRKKNIVLNGKKSDGSQILNPKDSIKVFFSDETFTKMRGLEESYEDYDYLKKLKCPRLDIIFEDKDILVVNKPKEVLSQKSKANDISINEWILHYLISENKLSKEDFAIFKPSVCNRLDFNTSGLILASKSLKGAQELSLALKNKASKKYYYAIVAGKLENDIKLEGYLIKDKKDNKVTVYKDLPKGVDQSKFNLIKTNVEVISSNSKYSVLKIQLITGKTHQIRAHLASISHPIIGDMKYGNNQVNDEFYQKYKISSQLLHAYSFSYKDQTFIADLPKEFQLFL